MSSFGMMALLVNPEAVWLWSVALAHFTLSLMALAHSLSGLGRQARLPSWAGPALFLTLDVGLICFFSWAYGSTWSTIRVVLPILILAYTLVMGRGWGLVALLLALVTYSGTILLEMTGHLPLWPLNPQRELVEILQAAEPGRVYGALGTVAASLVGAYVFVVTLMKILERTESERRSLAASQAAQSRSLELQRQVEEAQHLESLGRLAGGIAHDFNNLLTGIVGYARALYDDASPESDARRDLAEIISAVDRGGALTAQLLAVGRRQVTEPRLLDLNELVQEVTRMLERLLDEDILLDLRLDEAGVKVRVDRSQLEQTLINLILNARDAIEGSGRVTITTSTTHISASHALALAGEAVAGDYSVLEVQDTGQGMDEEVLRQIFEPFFTTKGQRGGTGLGLATAYGTIKQHGGLVVVDSVPGQGSTFRVLLPRSEGEVEPLQHPPPPQPVARGRATILLVDDEAMVRRSTMRLLTSQGYDVVCARDGDEAEERFVDHGQIDLLLSDVVLPGRSGPTLAKQLRGQEPELRVMLMSGYAYDALEADGALGEDMSFISKPFSPQEFLRAVSGALSG